MAVAERRTVADRDRARRERFTRSMGAAPNAGAWKVSGAATVGGERLLD
jgi:hypothetical protein